VEVFAVQDEMSRDIIKSLGLTPTASETQRIARPPTANLEAYDDYLRGEQATRAGRPSALREALGGQAGESELTVKLGFETSLKRLKCANTGRSPVAWRAGQSNPIRSAT
jgi:adenylate cyclase